MTHPKPWFPSSQEGSDFLLISCKTILHLYQKDHIITQQSPMVYSLAVRTRQKWGSNPTSSISFFTKDYESELGPNTFNFVCHTAQPQVMLWNYHFIRNNGKFWLKWALWFLNSKKNPPYLTALLKFSIASNPISEVKKIFLHTCK